jgi:hypothetical protein
MFSPRIKIKRVTIGILRSACLAAAIPVALSPLPANAGKGLNITIGHEGLASLEFRGQEFLAKGPASIRWLRFPGDEKSAVADGQDRNRRVEGRAIVRTYDGLVVSTTFQPTDDALNFDVAFKNTTDQSISEISFRPFAIQFPRRPQGSRWKWAYTVTTDNDGEPGVVVADCGATKVLACCDEVERPVTFGFEGHFGHQGPNPVLVEIAELKTGEQRTDHFSLRFGGADAEPLLIAHDIYEQFAQIYPARLKWPDRRPIGALFFCQSDTKWPTNPRGWFSDEKVDVTTVAGRQVFAKRLMTYADQSIAELKDVGAQGMVVWDVEGQEMPHAISYLGDPRVLPRAAPEMDVLADEFFARFRKAGLKVGVCIRPSRIVPNGKGGWKHVQVDNPVGEMSEKIAYAQKRWGCTIFYLDTNVMWDIGMWQGKSSILASADIERLTRLHPDVLVIPEFGRFGYWAYCMPYGELRGGSPGTSPAIRSAYPAAGSVVAVGDGDYLGNWDALLKGAAAGDIQLFRGWFADSRNALVKQLYHEADVLRRARSSAPPPRSLASGLADKDPLMRWLAVDRANPKDHEASTTLVRRVAFETDWTVRKKMIEAMGESRNSAAVSALVPFVRDGRLHLDHFAATALGQIGRPSGPILAQLAADKDPRVAEQALGALENVDEPRSLTLLLELADRSKDPLRQPAIRALGGQTSPKSVTKLITLLKESDRGVLIAACGALARQRSKAAVKPLVDLIERSVSVLHDNDVRLAAGDALEAITGLEFGPYETSWRAALKAGKL